MLDYSQSTESQLKSEGTLGGLSSSDGYLVIYIQSFPEVNINSFLFILLMLKSQEMIKFIDQRLMKFFFYFIAQIKDYSSIIFT